MLRVEFAKTEAFAVALSKVASFNTPTFIVTLFAMKLFAREDVISTLSIVPSMNELVEMVMFSAFESNKFDS